MQLIIDRGHEKLYYATYWHAKNNILFFIICSEKQQGMPPPMPSGLETGIYGKEVHVSTQKQTQKEIKGDLEITRHQTVTETREQQHKAITKERKVAGPVVRKIYFYIIPQQIFFLLFSYESRYENNCYFFIYF